MTWYNIPMTEDGLPEEIPAPSYMVKFEDYFYALTDETIAYPELTREQVEAKGLNYDRTISGA